MVKFKILLTTVGIVLLTACGKPDTQQAQRENEQADIVLEADSVSAELSASSDAVEVKVNELQATLDSLNNE